MSVARGTVVWVSLDPALGHEQSGGRPCVVLSPQHVVEAVRFPLVGVVPLTSRTDLGDPYPLVRPGSSGVRVPSCALVDNVRSVDKRRITRTFGVVAPEEQSAIDAAVSWFLGVVSREPPSAPR